MPGPNLNVCGVTRTLVPAFFVAFAVASLTASDALGWAAAAVTAIAIVASRRIRGAEATCALPAPPPARDRTAPATAHHDAEATSA